MFYDDTVHAAAIIVRIKPPSNQPQLAWFLVRSKLLALLHRSLPDVAPIRMATVTIATVVAYHGH